ESYSPLMSAPSLHDALPILKGQRGGMVDLTFSGAAFTGPTAFAEAGVTPADIDYASIYDSFTITVLIQLEDLGFCAKGKGGAFVDRKSTRLNSSHVKISYAV